MLGMIYDGLRELDRATDPSEVVKIGRLLEAIETAMRATGMYQPEQVREANEGKIKARWKLGRLLSQIEKGTGPGRGKKVSHGEKSFSLMALYRQWDLDKTRASEAQRIAAMPEPKLEGALAKYRGTEDFMTFRELILYARPFWNQEKRVANHARIVKQAAKAKAPDRLGPFPLFYLDPPWTFEVHTPETTSRMADDHYPVLTDDQIVNITFGGQSITELAHDDASMFMWCTSSNLQRALEVMELVGFEYKTHAVWDKGKIGLGLVFRNQHEVLLYGSRGSPPKPVELHPSVFSGKKFKRGRHSEKPDEVRRILERMYPHYTKEHRVEIFARGKIDGWTILGHEADD
jgi:N6-adenosine-specific RNA methylase IME4